MSVDRKLLNVVEGLDVPNLTVIVGKRASGKSHIVRWLLYHLFNKHIESMSGLYEFSSTAFSGWYEQFVPKEFIYENADPFFI